MALGAERESERAEGALSRRRTVQALARELGAVLPASADLLAFVEARDVALLRQLGQAS